MIKLKDDLVAKRGGTRDYGGAWKLCHNPERHIPGMTPMKQTFPTNKRPQPVGKH